MSNETLMAPAEFADRLDRAFGHEPAQADPRADLARGKRRLRRRRAGASLAALATVGVVGAVASLVPGGLGAGDRERDVAPAAGGVAQLSRADVLERCTTGENAMFFDGRESLDEQRAVALLGETPRVMTWAAVDHRTQATLLSQDGRYWGDCQFRNAPDNGVKNALAVYPTTLELAGIRVGGVSAYAPIEESDPRIEGGANVPVPDLEVPCVSPLTDEERWAVDAECPEFTLFWNDLRPAEVAAVKVVAPDGVASWADVREGHVSFAYTGEMTPEISAAITRGEEPGAKRVVFYDAEGDVLVDDRDPGHLPAKGELSMSNFPSLSLWLK
jgi:hypothetical protein